MRENKVKTSVTLDAELVRRLKEVAKQERRSVSSLITMCLEDMVAGIESEAAPAQEKVT